jgi:hypothetical protein
MKTLTVLMAIGLSVALLPACSGRPALSDNYSQSFQRVRDAQVNARPRKPLGDLPASDAKIMMTNHQARYGKAGGKGSGSSGGGGGGGNSYGGGLVTPSTGDIGSDDDGGGSSNYKQPKITLRAK